MSDQAPTPPRMALADARYVGMAVSAIAFAASFAWPSFEKVRVLWYYPLERRWALQVASDGLAIDWYGRTLLSAAVSIAAYLVARAVASRTRPLGERGRTLWTAWMVTAVLLSMALFTHQLVSRRPVPAPLPSWYVPK